MGDVAQANADYAAAGSEYSAGAAVLERLIENNRDVRYAREWLPAIQQRLRWVELAPVAIGDWDALLARPAEELPVLLMTRLALLTEKQQTADVEQAAAKLQELAASAPAESDPKVLQGAKRSMLYNAACGYGLCAKLSAGWDHYRSTRNLRHGQ